MDVAATEPAHLGLLRERVARRWRQWRALRWCARLTTLNAAQFEAEIVRGPPDVDDWSNGARDEAVRTAIDELTQADRTLLGLLLQEATPHEIAARLGITEAQARQSSKALLYMLVREAYMMPMKTSQRSGSNIKS